MTILFCSDFGVEKRTQLGEEHMNENIMTQAKSGGEKRNPTVRLISLPACACCLCFISQRGLCSLGQRQAHISKAELCQCLSGGSSCEMVRCCFVSWWNLIYLHGKLRTTFFPKHSTAAGPLLIHRSTCIWKMDDLSSVNKDDYQ